MADGTSTGFEPETEESNFELEIEEMELIASPGTIMND